VSYCNKEILKADPRVMLCIALPAIVLATAAAILVLP